MRVRHRPPSSPDLSRFVRVLESFSWIWPVFLPLVYLSLGLADPGDPLLPGVALDKFLTPIFNYSMVGPDPLLFCQAIRMDGGQACVEKVAGDVREALTFGLLVGHCGNLVYLPGSGCRPVKAKNVLTSVRISASQLSGLTSALVRNVAICIWRKLFG